MGPNLGMVKSSSLESLHNIVSHTIKRDVGPGVGELRTRETRNSFRRAVDHSLKDGASTQREVDGERRGGRRGGRGREGMASIGGSALELMYMYTTLTHNYNFVHVYVSLSSFPPLSLFLSFISQCSMNLIVHVSPCGMKSTCTCTCNIPMS